MSSNKADQSPKPESRPRVLVLGGGFAGIGAARKLGQADVDVVVIDGHDYHTFQPMLYQVATDLLPQGGGPSGSAVDRGGPGQGGRRLDLGRLHARTGWADHRSDQ